MCANDPQQRGYPPGCATTSSNLVSPKINDDSQDTLFVTLDHLTAAKFTLKKTADPCETRVHAAYHGTTEQGLNLHLKDESLERRIQAKNVPADFVLDFNSAGLMDTTLEVSEISEPIEEMSVAWRLTRSCGEKNLPFDLMVNATDIPATPWKLGLQFGVAGYLGLHAGEEEFGDIEIGLSVPGHVDRYFALHMAQASFGFEWDLDGHSGTEQNPYYVYCDGADALWTLRVRWEMFGLGVRPDGPGALNYDCDELQAKWYFAPTTIPVCSPSFGCVNTSPTLPHFKRSGNLHWTGKLPVVEILFANHWFRTPDKLWET